MAENGKKPITKDERTQLQKLVTQRFVVLRKQLDQREQEVQEQVRQEILESHRSETTKVSKAVQKLEEKHRALLDEARALVEEHPDVHIAFDSYHPLKERNSSYGFTVKPEGFDEEVRRRMKEIRLQAGAHGLSLYERETQLQQQVLLNSLETDTAKELFDIIPSIDDLFPLDSGMKRAIEAGAKGDEPVGA